MATARFMETWAHGRDVADALGVELPPDDRVRHVVHLGVRTRGFAYANRGPRAAGRRGPGRADRCPRGEVVEHGPADAAGAVTGSAYDFALLVTQRRHRDDLDLVAVGDDADRLAGHRAGVRRSARAGTGAVA